MQTHRGSCHCGRVTFELDADITHAVECNCSICRRAGALWHGASDAQLRIQSGESELILYQFNTMTAKHYFCRHCGIHPFSRPRLNPAIWVVNLRCIGDIDLKSVKTQLFDGEHWEAAAKAFLAQQRGASTRS
jgi:hypothetical protein